MIRPGAKVKVSGFVESVDPTLRYAFTRAYYWHDKCGGEFYWPPEGREEGWDPLSPDKPTVCPVCGEGGGKFQLIPEKSEGFPYATLTLAIREELEEGLLPTLKQVLVVVPQHLKLPGPGAEVVVEGGVRLMRDRALYLIAEKITTTP